jgi:hypothetical protein
MRYLSFILVSMLWGCTNPFVKRGSEIIDKLDTTGNIWKKLNAFRTILTSPSLFIPICVNQLGSILFYFLLATENISLAVPICNSLTFAFTGITAYIIGEKVQYPIYLFAGVGLVVLGISICVSS